MAYTTIKKPSDYFNTVLYTGNGVDDRSITGVGFQPDFTWIKSRTTTDYHTLFDVVRGVGKRIFSNVTEAEDTTPDSLQAFESDGFEVGTNNGVNGNNYNFVSWNWLGANGTAANTDGSISSTVSANTTSGFSIVSWTGTNATGTVGHGLGSTPKVVIYKNRTDVTNWYFTTTVIDGSNDLLFLNTTEASQTFSAPVATNSLLNLIANNDTNGSGDNIIAYCFAEKQGYSKFGSYVGNGNADGTFVYTGFKPAFVMVKNVNSGAQGWLMFDDERSPFNVANKFMVANLSQAEASTSTHTMDFLSNGFKIRGTDDGVNGSGNTIIYMAFAEQPLVGDNPATAR